MNTSSESLGANISICDSLFQLNEDNIDLNQVSGLAYILKVTFLKLTYC